MTFSILGLVGGLLLLIFLTIRGMNLMLAGPLCAFLVALSSSIPLHSLAANEVTFFSGYMQGFAGFVQSWFLMFLFGSLFGRLMDESGSAESIANAILKRLGTKYAALAVVASCAVLTFGGVSVFVVAFAVFPMALNLFQKANLPRRFIPGALAFGSVTFTMTSAGSPEIQNWIPIKYLGTTPYAAWQVSLIVALFMACIGAFWLNKMIAKAVARGEKFETRIGDQESVTAKALPHPLMALVPLLIVIITSLFLHGVLKQNALVVALLAGVLSCWLLNLKFISNIGGAVNLGAQGALLAIGNTAAVVGFGSIAKATPAFSAAVSAMTQIPGNELVGAAVAVSVIAGLTGSASGGQSIALPLLAPHYMALGVDPEQLHRIVAISSGAIDSLPHNGYVVTTVRAICGETHKDAYAPVGALTVLLPLMGVTLALVLFSLGM